jgi:hypothetical protein
MPAEASAAAGRMPRPQEVSHEVLLEHLATHTDLPSHSAEARGFSTKWGSK